MDPPDGLSLNAHLWEPCALFATFTIAFLAFIFLDALSKKPGPNKFPVRFLHFSSAKGFNKRLILKQAVFLPSTLIKLFMLLTRTNILCSRGMVFSFVGMVSELYRFAYKQVRGLSLLVVVPKFCTGNTLSQIMDSSHSCVADSSSQSLTLGLDGHCTLE